jgi:hypothetical protein
MEKSAKYIAKKSKIVEKEVTKFVNDFLDGKLKRSLKSEEIPDDWDANPVKVSLLFSDTKECNLPNGICLGSRVQELQGSRFGQGKGCFRRVLCSVVR